MTESEIVAALVPHYANLVCSLEAEGYSSEDAIVGAGSVDEWIETDFGLVGRRFLFVSVKGTRGICAQCPFQRIAVFGLPEKELLFRFENEGIAPASALRVFPLFPEDRTLTLSFATGAASLNMGGWHELRSEWYRPRLNSDGGIEFIRVWSGIYDYGTTDNSSWLTESSCGSMALVPGKQRYERRARSFYGGLDPDQEPWGSDEGLSEGRESCICYSCGIEISHRQVWAPRFPPGGSLRAIGETVRRIDRFPVPTFPFDLPKRAVSYRRQEVGTKIRFGMQRHVEVPSPSGALTLIWDYEDPTRNEFRVETSEGEAKRALSLPPSTANYVKKTFLRRVVSLGWQNDDRRFFAVVEIGSEDWALLSFGVSDTRDYWERPLPAREDSWPFGFVLARSGRSR